jgi:hypothetical protein
VHPLQARRKGPLHRGLLLETPDREGAEHGVVAEAVAAGREARRLAMDPGILARVRIAFT